MANEAKREALIALLYSWHPFLDSSVSDPSSAVIRPYSEIPEWYRRGIEKRADALMALAEPQVSDDTVRERWRHVKRGTVYEVIGEAELQNANTPGLREGAALTVYRGDEGKLWAREHNEFRDGRFERLTASHPKPEPVETKP